MVETSPGKVLKLSARAAKLYLMCLSVTVGFRGNWHTHRPHPASLLVRVPAVVHLLRASFRLASRFPPCVSLRLSLLLPVTSFQVTSFSPCWAHQYVSLLHPTELNPKINKFQTIYSLYQSDLLQHTNFERRD
jgi:hypothetical protein